MKRWVFLVSVAVACTKSPEPVTLPTVASHASASAVAVSHTCAITVGSARPLSIPPELSALAPQYFHANARDEGFNDLIVGTRRYRWYDPSNLDASVEPPPDMTMIRRSTKSFFVGWSDDGTIRVVRRLDKTSTKTSFKLYLLDAIEDASGYGWLLAGDTLSPHVTTAAHVLRVDPSLTVTDMGVATLTGKDPWDRRLANTADGHVGVVWVSETTDGLSVMASWLGPSGFAAPVALDHVVIPALAIELSLRSTTDLRVASEGSDRIAVAWRPLAPKDGEVVDVGSALEPPETPTTAEVCIFTAHPSGTVSPSRVHMTVALPLMDTSGVGPWPLYGNGMVSATLAGHAIFFWNETKGADQGVVYATPDDAAPHAVMSGSFRLLPRATTTANSLELLLLRSTGSQQLVPITCL